MAEAASNEQLLDHGTLSFSVETRVLRELGERLVKQPEVAIVELIKNAYDADASRVRGRVQSGDANCRGGRWLPV